MNNVMDPYEIAELEPSRKYVKKPVIIEAIQYKGNGAEELKEIADFIGTKELEIVCTDKLPQIKICTMKGAMLANIDDYIIKDRLGLVSPCPADVFQDMYESMK